MRTTTRTWLAALLAAVMALPTAQTTDSHVLHEKRTNTPREWRRGDRVNEDALLPIRIGLVQSNLDDAYEHLMDVSHPASPNYGKHWKAEDVHAMYSPSEEAVAAVRAWLESEGVGDVVHSDNKGWLAFDIPASQAEALFSTEYYEFEHKMSTDKIKVGCDGYHVPADLAHHIDYITPGVALSPALVKRSVDVLDKRAHPAGKWLSGRPGRRLSHRAAAPPAISHLQTRQSNISSNLSRCATRITPACVKALYGIPDMPTEVDDVNALGVFEASDAYAQADLDLFFQLYAPHIPQGTHPTLNSIDGGQDPSSPDAPVYGESDFDLEVAYSLIYPQKIILYQVDDSTYVNLDSKVYFNSFLDALDGSYCTYSAYGVTGNDPAIDSMYPNPAEGGYKGDLMCGTYKPTRVISISYGVSEFDAPLNYTKRQCNELLKLGLQGVTFVWASGDDGVAAFHGDDSASGCLGKDEKLFNPLFPTCPYVTSVGGTQLWAGQTLSDPESALAGPLEHGGTAYSGGGFANYFPVPDYQQSAVSTYFQNHDPDLPYYTARNDSVGITNMGENHGLYNRAGRGTPDVSANAGPFQLIYKEQHIALYGTSFSAPVWASIITMINQERTNVGKGPVGFINPVLYANPGVLNDVVNGSNPGCGSEGFKAAEGWDPVTGLGTPNYPKLLELFMGLP